MKSNKGLAQDTRPENQLDGTYPYGKNGIQFDLKGSITNEKGFRRLADVIPPGWQINGILSTDDNRVIIFHTNNVGSRIILFDVESQTVTWLFDDAAFFYKLGFKVENYITGQVQRNHKGELICAFTDKVTFPKCINFDNQSVNALKDWNLFPECTYPTITKQVETGGLLQVGSYFFAVRYYKQDGTKTAFSQVSSGIVITTTDEGDIADKSIELTLTGMDTAYDFLEIAVIQKIKGVVKAIVLTKIPVVSGTTNVSYSDDSLAETITLEEVLVAPVFYNKVGTMTQLNDALYVGKLEAPKPLIDMQKYANLIELCWVSELQDVAINPSEELKNGTKKGFMHGEVYAFYIRYKLSNGSNSIDFTIPGKPLLTGQDTLSTIASVGSIAAPIFKVEDCITTYSTISKSGLTGPYQNDDELYPNDVNFDSTSVGGLDNRNQKVRHHKMPSLKWCKETLYSTDPEYGKTKLDILGVQAYNIVIPPEYTDVIIGYEILYAKRTIHNMTNYGEGLSLYATQSSTSAIEQLSMGHNYIQGTFYFPNQSFLRFHAFDLLYSKPGIKPAYVASQYLMTKSIDTKYTAWSYPTSGSPSDSYGNNCHLVDMTGATVTNSPVNNINGISDTKYLLNNTNNGTWINQYMETAFVGHLAGTPMPILAGMNLSPEGTLAPGAYDKVDAYLMTMQDIKDNIYDNFYTQQLISAGDYTLLSTPKVFFGGDVFLSLYTFHTYGIVDGAWASHYDDGSHISDPEFRGRRFVHRFVCETVANLYTRFEITGNNYSKWYDHNPLPAFGTTTDWNSVYPVPYNGLIDPNQFGYNKGSEGINDFVTSNIYNPFRDYLYKFPYRIHRGGKLSRQNTRSWKTFLALDYYECQKNMGHIQHLEGMDDRLLIHHENALFLTQDKTKLESGLLAVTLGSGDIFQFEPQEALSSKLGFAGTQHDLACVRTPIGYIFVDSKQGEIYLYKPLDRKSAPVSLTNMMRRFLRRYLNIKGNNPFVANGITLGWDQQYKRILASVKNVQPSSLASYQNIPVANSPEELPVTLTPGDVIFYQGKYLEYLGENGVYPYYIGNCPPDTCYCDPIANLAVEVLQDNVTTTVSWSSSAGGFIWTLYEISATGLILISSGSTTSTFVVLPNAPGVLEEDKLYYVSVVAQCAECSSTPVGITWTTQYDEVIVVDPITPGSPRSAVVAHSVYLKNETPTGPQIPNADWRISSNNGAFYGHDQDSNCYIGSNPTITLNDPFFGASLVIEYRHGGIGPGNWGTGLSLEYAIQHVAVDCKDNLNPASAPYVGFPPIYTIDLIPVPSSAYIGVNSYGAVTVGYYKWQFPTQRVWIGPDSTTFTDPGPYGTIGPLTHLSVLIYEL